MQLKQRTKPTNDPRKVIQQRTENESYKRYKRLEYTKLAVKCFVTFILGMLFSHFFIG